jgi:ubiquinone/menaquinone biosynthesis C-methylase UbiE
VLQGFSDPEKNVEQLGLSSGMRVADFGAGSGFYVIASSLRVGEAGKIYAVDIQKDLLVRFKNELQKRGIDNVEIVWADLEKVGGSKLAPFSMDAVLATNIMFQLDDKDSFVKEISRVLRPGGKVLLVDWSESFGGLGPTEDRVISKADAISFFEKEGFVVEKDISAGAHHYGAVLRKK